RPGSHIWQLLHRRLGEGINDELATEDTENTERKIRSGFPPFPSLLSVFSVSSVANSSAHRGASMSLASDLKILFHMTLAPIRGQSHRDRLESFYASQARSYD